ncbi:MAG: hypothetical protein Q8N23_31875 [Archangium sp.]|nr:hypothetical protein [Archangium sp.]MDP3157315.1 hypothetical protein [Archangium sp.]MDP3571153.1 hypothetical protein [Archangium sp.]
MRRALLLAMISLWALPAMAVKVPGDVGIGPAGFWFFGPLTANRGAVPHFGIAFDLQAIIDRDWIQDNQASIPAKYRAMADRVTELKIGASIFIPSTLYISPPFDALKSTGMFGATWTPLGLTLVSTGQKSAKEWNKSRGRFSLDAHLLLTYLFIFNTGGYAIPTTHFLRPGLQLRSTILLNVTDRFLLGFGGGAQIYIPQRMGSSFGIGPMDENMWLSVFAFLQFHVRFPYEVSL